MAGIGAVGSRLVSVYDARLQPRAGGGEAERPLEDEAEALREEPSRAGDQPLPESNVGHRLLLKMGWGGAGTGLGAKGDGRAEPVASAAEQSRLGLGKREQDDAMTAAENVERRELNTERQARETEEERRARERKATRELSVRDNKLAVAEAYRCALCDKQYAHVDEYEGHCSSYDHHHRKRLAELREDERARGREERERERRREEKLEARALERQQQALAAAEALVAAEPEADAVAEAAPLPSVVTGFSFGGAAIRARPAARPVLALAAHDSD